jgi:hypothetical protein
MIKMAGQSAAASKDSGSNVTDDPNSEKSSAAGTQNIEAEISEVRREILSLEMTDEELEELCNQLCNSGACPPGCPGDYNPPWGPQRLTKRLQ